MTTGVDVPLLEPQSNPSSLDLLSTTVVVGVGEINVDGEIPIESFYTRHLLELGWDTGNSIQHDSH